MKRRLCNVRPGIALALSLCVMGSLLSPSMAADQKKFVIKPVVEKKLKQLPAGPLYWQLENFPTLAQAQAAAGETSMAAEVAGKIWLFTLEPRIARHAAAAGSLRLGRYPQSPRPSICCASTMRAVLRGPRRRCIRIRVPKASTRWRVGWVKKRRTACTTPTLGESMNGHGPGTAMEVFSSGTADLDQIVLFVADASKPFSTPAKLK